MTSHSTVSPTPLLLKEALAIVRRATYSDQRRLALVCSFEPLHLSVFLQAHLSLRFPDVAPALVAFGFDRLTSALDETSATLRHDPAICFLNWDDLHPCLSWRSRGALTISSLDELDQTAGALRSRLLHWVGQRRGADSYVAFAPPSWMAPVDATPTFGIGAVGIRAEWHFLSIANDLAAVGARVLDLPVQSLNYRELLSAGCPMTVDESSSVAERIVGAAFPARERAKAVVVDVDGTLWDGVIGEDGTERLQYGPEGKGYLFHNFQKLLLKLKDEGIFVAFCTKNNPSDLLPVFDGLEMPLRLKDFSAYRCNWDPKSRNIREIAAELNIGLEAVVYVDDNPVELSEVAHQLPGVTVLRAASSAADWLGFQATLRDLCHTWRVSDEDRLRVNEAYRERQRDGIPVPVIPDGSAPDSFRHMRDLQLSVAVRPDAFGDPRSLELINKTNQFNLTGERIASADWLRWQEQPTALCMSARLKDRFGNFGTIAVIAGDAFNGQLAVRHFVLSCRAFGRGVEQVLLAAAAERAGANQIGGPFRATGKNEPALRFLQALECVWISDGAWSISRAALREAVEAVRAEGEIEVTVDESGAHAPSVAR